MEKENSILSEKQPRNKQQKEETDSFVSLHKYDRK